MARDVSRRRRASADSPTQSTPHARPSRRRAETRRRLLHAALATFADRGFYGASVEDICERAGFTRGAFYSNFASKEELFFALYAEQARRLVAALAASVPDVTPETAASFGPDAINAAVERFLAVRPDDRQWFLVNAEFTLHAVRHPETARALAAHRREVRAQIAQLLIQALADAGREPTIDADTMARAVLALHDSSTEYGFLEPGAAPDRELERQVVPVLLRAISRDVAGAGKPADPEQRSAE